MNAPPRTVVVGTGLIGASMAAAARRAGAFGHTIGVGRSGANLATALERGLVDAVSHDLAAAVADAELVVLATPVRTAVAQLAEVAAAAPPEAVITDVGSVKAPIVRRAAELGLGARFVAAHPMAGSERSGASAADPDLFRDAVVVIVPSSPRGQDAPRACVEEIWRRVGARILAMDAATHDAAVAGASHLPQMLAFALGATTAARADAADVARVAGRGFADMTRLAASDPDMWADIVAANAGPVAEAVDAVAALLVAVAADIRAGREGDVRALMETARRWKTAGGAR